MSKKKSKVEVTWEMHGKMKGMMSISTSVTTNPNCQRNSKIPGSICEFCYSAEMAKQYTNLDAKNQRNTDLLTTTLVPDEDLPVVDPEQYPWCRLEAFGDLHNEMQLDNYMNIVRKNNKSKWTLYTKMYLLVRDYFSTHDVPENFSLVISSLFVNRPAKEIYDSIKATGKFKDGQLKLFTVYDKDYIAKHPELKINCGARSCLKCHRCYDQRAESEVNEILKKDAASAAFLIGLRDPDKVKTMLDRIKIEK